MKEDHFDDPRFQKLKTKDVCYDDLVTEIVSKARGMLAWVFLVVRSLKRELTSEDIIVELQGRLRGLLTDLEESFQRMLDSVEGIHHKQAARIYLMRLDAPGFFSTTTVSYFDEDNPDFGLEAPMAPYRLEVMKERSTITRIWVMARCTDLLEVSRGLSDDGKVARSRGNFLQQTIHDFVQTSKIHVLLTERAGKTFDTKLFVLQCLAVSDEICEALLPAPW